MLDKIELSNFLISLKVLSSFLYYYLLLKFFFLMLLNLNIFQIKMNNNDDPESVDSSQVDKNDW